jgi:CMP-N-acetylneuraminic acid synthetase
LDKLVTAIAIIPARGGSKRIPHKNIADVGGKPLLAWTVEAALESDCFEHVIVSTDDEKIAEAGREFGAEVPFLRNVNADDHATASQATLTALAQAEQTFSSEFDIVCQLMATTPLRTADHIVEAMKQFDRSRAPAQISCVAFEWQNPWWAVTLDQQGHPTALFPEKRNARSQDLEQLYAPSGAIWLARTAQLKTAESFYLDGLTYCPIDWRAAIDIDTPSDLELVREMARHGERTK